MRAHWGGVEGCIIKTFICLNMSRSKNHTRRVMLGTPHSHVHENVHIGGGSECSVTHTSASENVRHREEQVKAPGVWVCDACDDDDRDGSDDDDEWITTVL